MHEMELPGQHIIDTMSQLAVRLLISSALVGIQGPLARRDMRKHVAATSTDDPGHGYILAPFSRGLGTYPASPIWRGFMRNAIAFSECPSATDQVASGRLVQVTQILEASIVIAVVAYSQTPSVPEFFIVMLCAPFIVASHLIIAWS